MNTMQIHFNNSLTENFPKAYLSLRNAGNMSFLHSKNKPRRDEWLKSLGFNPEESALVDLIHSRKVVEAKAPKDCFGVEADGIIAPANCETKSIVITVADCMPIFLYDAYTACFALLHSGWQGTGILREAVNFMTTNYGTKAANIHAAFGPHIGTCCYVVDEERAKKFVKEFGQQSVTYIDNKPRLDLYAANLSIANELGIASISHSNMCTACNLNLGSFRREGVNNFTRMAAVIGWPN